MTQRALRAGGNKALPRSECTSSELVSISRELVGIADPDDEDQPSAASLLGISGEQEAQRSTNERDARIASEQIKRSLVKEASSELATIRQHCLKYVDNPDSEIGKEHLNKVYQGIRY